MSDLGPTALVVRGGARLSAEALVEQLEGAVEDGDGPVLSLFCDDPADGESSEETLYRICATADIPHSKVFVAQQAGIAAVGVALESETGDGQAVNHYHARFDLPVGTSQVQDFIACFDGPILNPTGGKKRSAR